MDDDEHIFYSPLASTKARNPYIVLGFTPIKRFSQQEVSPKGKGKTSTVQQKSIEKTAVRKETTRSSPPKPPAVEEKKAAPKPTGDFTLNEKLAQLKEYLGSDVTLLEKEDKQKLDRLENLQNTHEGIIESQNMTLDKLWGDRMNGLQNELSKGNEDIKKRQSTTTKQINDLNTQWSEEVRKQDGFKKTIQTKVGSTYQQDPSTIVKGGMKTDGMKVINDYIKPEIDRSVKSSIDSLKSSDQSLYAQVDSLSSKVYELDAERTRLSENQLDELENNYLEDLKDARARLANTQDETAKLKLEFVNQIDKLAYEIEEGARLN